jgi:hypothetical protein
MSDIDIDGDSTMHSSPELEADDEMFPDEAGGPSTPTNPSAFSLNVASELSPPGSQGPAQLAPQTETAAAPGAIASTTVNENGKRAYPSTAQAMATETQQIGVQVDRATGYTWDRQEDEPGYDWMNKRAQEEAARAYDGIIDKGSMIKLRYGDPLDASVPAKRR